MATDKISEILKALLLKATVDATAPLSAIDEKIFTDLSYSKGYNACLDDITGEWEALIEYCASLNKHHREALTYLLSKQIISIVARINAELGYKVTIHLHHELDYQNKVGELNPAQLVEIAKFLRNRPIEVLDCAVRYWIFYHYNQLPQTKHQTEYFNYLKDTVERIRSTGV